MIFRTQKQIIIWFDSQDIKNGNQIKTEKHSPALKNQIEAQELRLSMEMEPDPNFHARD